MQLDDVILPQEEFVILRESARWMAVVKVHTTKHFGNQPFFQKMDVAWGFARKWSTCGGEPVHPPGLLPRRLE
jgi:hypothetical protein